MSPLIIVVLAVALATVLIAWLIRRGFRDGDIESDVAVRARALVPARPHVGSGVPGQGRTGAGAWIEVTVTNPSQAIALVGLSLRRSRVPELLASGPGRRGPGPRTRLRLADQVLGTVCADEAERFWLWADPDRRRLMVHAAVGTPGRLRLHRVAVQHPARPMQRPAWPARDLPPTAASIEADQGRAA
jgi:hypothetical protein